MPAVDLCCCADNHAGPTGIQALAEALQAGGCPSLQHLDIISECALLLVVVLWWVVWAAGVVQWVGAGRRVLVVVYVVDVAVEVQSMRSRYDRQ